MTKYYSIRDIDNYTLIFQQSPYSLRDLLGIKYQIVQCFFNFSHSFIKPSHVSMSSRCGKGAIEGVAFKMPFTLFAFTLCHWYGIQQLLKLALLLIGSLLCTFFMVDQSIENLFEYVDKKVDKCHYTGTQIEIDCAT